MGKNGVNGAARKMRGLDGKGAYEKELSRLRWSW
jgi:hypothetical protein